MLGFTQDEHFLYFILEYIQGGELFKYLRSVQSFTLKDSMFEILIF